MDIRAIRAVVLLLSVLTAGNPALAQKPGGTLKVYHRDSPASMSILEEATLSTSMPMMGVFNNLLLYDQHVPQNRLQAIVPELATGWSWSEDGKELSFTLRQGVKWHDGRPFTANDVKCTWDMLTGKSTEKLRINPRKAWYENLEEVTTDGNYAVTFRLRRPQPALLALLASGLAPVYPAMSRRATCGPIPSAPDRSNLSRSSQTKASGSRAIPITGNRGGPISTASTTRSSRTARRRSSALPPASST